MGLDLKLQVSGSPGVDRVDNHGEGHRIHIDGDDNVSTVLKMLVESGLTDVRTTQPTLEEVYIGLIGNRGLEV
jgi:ABC-2 type transport system ATP-binding protein